MICPVADERMCPISVMPKSHVMRGYGGSNDHERGYAMLPRKDVGKKQKSSRTKLWPDATLLLRAAICPLLSRSRSRVSIDPNVTLLLLYANYQFAWENPMRRCKCECYRYAAIIPRNVRKLPSCENITWPKAAWLACDVADINAVYTAV